MSDFSRAALFEATLVAIERMIDFPNQWVPGRAGREYPLAAPLVLR